MDYIYVFVLIVLCHIKDVGAETCGSLSYQEPAIQGRNITLVFRPNHFQSDWTLIVKYYKPGGNRHPRQFPFDINDNVYYIHVNSSVDDLNSSFVYVKYGGCFSNTIKLVLMKLKLCGYLYVRTLPVISGRDLELGYFPSPALIGLPLDYVRKWFDETSKTVMRLTDGHFSETELTNNEFVLTIHNLTSSGQYSVKCTKGRSNGDLYTDKVNINVIVPPGRPSLHSNVKVDDCSDCLVAVAGKPLADYLFCHTTGGTNPNVLLHIGKDKMRVQLFTKDRIRYVSNYTVKGEDHMTRVECSVENAAVDAPLNISAILYVAVKPQKPVLHVPTLKEGEPANITCISKGGRPTSRLSIMMAGMNMSESSETISVNDSRTKTNTIQMTLNVNAKREWNSKHIICTQKTDIFSDNESDRKLIKCKYPPSTLFMEKPRPPRELKEAYVLTLRCNISDFNDNCSLNWNWDTSKLGGKTEQSNGLSTLVVNATKEDNENSFICSVHCSSFQVNLSDSYTIRLPSKPEIRNSSITSGVVAGFGGLVLLTATVVLTIYLRKRKKRAERPGRQNDPNVLPHVTREADSILSEEVTYAEVVKPRTLMTNRTKAVTKTKEQTTDTLIYADLDIEHMNAARTAVTKRTPSAPTEYSEIRFATRSPPAGQENIYAN